MSARLRLCLLGVLSEIFVEDNSQTKLTNPSETSTVDRGGDRSRDRVGHNGSRERVLRTLQTW